MLSCNQEQAQKGTAECCMRIMFAHSKSQEGFTLGLPLLPGAQVYDRASFVSEVATSNKAKGKATYWRMRTVS